MIWKGCNVLLNDGARVWSDGRSMWEQSRLVWDDGKRVWSDAKKIWMVAKVKAGLVEGSAAVSSSLVEVDEHIPSTDVKALSGSTDHRTSVEMRMELQDWRQSAEPKSISV